MEIYELYIVEDESLVILVDKDGNVQSVQHFDDCDSGADSAIELCQDAIEKIFGTRPERKSMSIRKFLQEHCRVFPEVAS